MDNENKNADELKQDNVQENMPNNDEKKSEVSQNENVINESEQVSNTENKVKKKKPLKIITGFISFCIWVFVFFILCLLIVTSVSKKTDLFGYRMYLIMSGSMEPTIQARDAVITKQTDDFKVGDVIAYEEGNATIVHRIIEKQGEGDSAVFTTKGDANNTEDMDLVVKSQIKGIVKYTWPAIGRIVLFIQSYLLIFVIAIFILLVITIVRRLI